MFGEDDAGGFDENEAADLKLHVRQCARRYAVLARKIDMTIRLICALIVLHVLGVQGAASALWTFFAKVSP